MIEVKAPITGSVWVIEKRVGDKVCQDEPLIILESMKMEFPVLAPEAGTVESIPVTEAQQVTEGDVVVLLRP